MAAALTKAEWTSLALTCAMVVTAIIGGVHAAAAKQAPAAGANAQAGRGGGAVRLAPAYPTRPPADPAIVARGKAVFSVNCSFCHGADARGGESGPSLVRSQLVLDDKTGELITPVVQTGRVDKGMPKFDLPADQISDIVAFIHAQPLSSRGMVAVPVESLVGDAKAGQAFFSGAGKCSTCHSPTGDLAGIGGKFDTRALQGAMLGGGAPGRGTPGINVRTAKTPVATVTVTLPSGEKVEGALDRIDDFEVSLVESNGTHRTFTRNGDVPKVEIHNPLQAHLDMLHTLTDAQIHDLTAYLVTLK